MINNYKTVCNNSGFVIEEPHLEGCTLTRSDGLMTNTLPMMKEIMVQKRMSLTDGDILKCGRVMEMNN